MGLSETQYINIPPITREQFRISIRYNCYRRGIIYAPKCEQVITQAISEQNSLHRQQIEFSLYGYYFETNDFSSDNTLSTTNGFIFRKESGLYPAGVSEFVIYHLFNTDSTAISPTIMLLRKPMSIYQLLRID